METSDDAKALNDRRIGFFGRGGAGKSTAVVLLGRALVKDGYTVCIRDADSTNFGLHQALDLRDPPLPLIDHLGGMVFRGGAVTCPVDDPTPLRGVRMVLNKVPDERAESFLRQRLDDRRFDYAFRSQCQRTEETPVQPVYAAGWRDPNYGKVIGNVRHANQPTPTTKIPKGITP